MVIFETGRCQRCPNETPWCYVQETTPQNEDGVEELLCNVERCLMPELKELWAEGIVTVCSCCGHRDDDKAYIRVLPEYVARMEELGYERYEMHKCVFNAGSVSFRAKRVSVERQKPTPEGGRTIREIRLAWAKAAGLSEEGIKKYV